ncbi:tetrahydrofolate dehydrogenase/cyclohydrolase [Phlyctema vagabunda]|uniref:Tetrahydrofolate dehydrogenase/cyclohydrolase n=1 Tax=Phlyctema vagabunda TaxID=108571 RepID=A0ABR4P2P5_9HELO
MASAQVPATLAPSGSKPTPNCKVILANTIAKPFLEEIRNALSPESNNHRPKLVGFLATEDEGSQIYADYTAKTCTENAVEYELRRVRPEDLENEIVKANEDANVNGIMVYYPIFPQETRRDQYLQSVVCPQKDVEGLCHRYLFNMYQNVRFLDPPMNQMKSILPCTPLAIIKVLEYTQVYNPTLAYGNRLYGKVITVINRSEVVGRPLAALLANDGATVYSVDITGIQVFSRGDGIQQASHDCHHSNRKIEDVLPLSDVVVSGVPSKAYQVPLKYLKAGSICINFANDKNFGPGVKDKASIYVPAIGKVTIAILLRNICRLVQIQRDLEVRTFLTPFSNDDLVWQLFYAYENGYPTYPVDVYGRKLSSQEITRESNTAQGRGTEEYAEDTMVQSTMYPQERGIEECTEDTAVQSTMYSPPPDAEHSGSSSELVWSLENRLHEPHPLFKPCYLGLDNHSVEQGPSSELLGSNKRTFSQISSNHPKGDRQDHEVMSGENTKKKKKYKIALLLPEDSTKDRVSKEQVHHNEDSSSVATSETQTIPTFTPNGDGKYALSGSKINSVPVGVPGMNTRTQVTDNSQTMGQSSANTSSPASMDSQPSPQLSTHVQPTPNIQPLPTLYFTVGSRESLRIFNCMGLRFSVVMDRNFVLPADYVPPRFEPGGPGGGGYWVRNGCVVASPPKQAFRSGGKPDPAHVAEFRQVLPVLYATGEMVGTIAQVCQTLGGDIHGDARHNFARQSQILRSLKNHPQHSRADIARNAFAANLAGSVSPPTLAPVAPAPTPMTATLGDQDVGAIATQGGSVQTRDAHLVMAPRHSNTAQGGFSIDPAPSFSDSPGNSNGPVNYTSDSDGARQNSAPEPIYEKDAEYEDHVYQWA